MLTWDEIALEDLVGEGAYAEVFRYTYHLHIHIHKIQMYLRNVHNAHRGPRLLFLFLFLSLSHFPSHRSQCDGETVAVKKFKQNVDGKYDS